MLSVLTDILEIFYEAGGPPTGPRVLLLHGWPDAPRGWRSVAKVLQSEGFRTVTPYLRGSQPTRFRANETPRCGAAVALASDALELANALEWERFAVLGHDWGARIAYALAALVPDRLTSIATLAVAYQPNGKFNVPDFEQSRRFWYQWFQCTDGGAEKVRQDPVGFARIQWETWSPPGWYDEPEFAATAESFLGPDWPAITLNAYRARWKKDEVFDDRYARLQEKIEETGSIEVPTLMIQGGSDACDPPSESEGREQFFQNGYRRVVWDGIGHFPQREAPERVATEVLEFFSNQGRS